MNLKTGYPFWLIKNGLLHNYPTLTNDVATDVIILGGGISGALAAYQLVESGIACCVIDARSIGLGSTCASTALLQYEIDTPLVELQHKVDLHNAVTSYKLCEKSIYSLGKIAEKLKLKTYAYKDSLYYAAYKKDDDFIQKEFLLRRQHGFPVQHLTNTIINKNYGFNASSAILSSVGATTDAYEFTHSLLQYCIKKGVEVYDRTKVVNILHKADGVKLTTQQGYSIKGKLLVYATGYESINYLPKKVVQLHTTFACISEAFNDKNAFWKDEALIWNTADPYFYMRTTEDNRIIIGGRDEASNNPRLRAKLLPKKTKQLTTDFNRIFPGINYKPEFSWAGTFGVTKDGLPYIGTYKGISNGFFALGFGGNGITFSQIAAELLKDYVLGKKNAANKIFAFDR